MITFYPPPPDVEPIDPARIDQDSPLGILLVSALGIAFFAGGAVGWLLRGLQ